MIVHRVPFASILLLVGAIAFAPAAFAQTALPRAAKEASSMAAYQQQIDAFVEGEVKRLLSDEPEDQKAAREALVGETMIGPGAPANSTYLATYAASINSNIKPALTASDVRQRLNAAIVVARVAEIARNDALLQSTTTLLNDKEAVVVIWGQKAAGWTLSALLARPNSDGVKQITTAIVAAAKKHTMAPVAQEAYAALMQGRSLQGDKLAAVIPSLLALYDWRAQQYIEAIPDEPLTENDVTTYLALNVWRNSPADQRVNVLQGITNLFMLASARAAAFPEEEREARDPVITVVKNVAKAMSVMEELKNDTNIKAAAENASKISNSTPSETIRENASAVFTLIRSKYPNLAEAPTIATTGPGAASGPVSDRIAAR
jgi:hypothetical protein